MKLFLLIIGAVCAVAALNCLGILKMIMPASTKSEYDLPDTLLLKDVYSLCSTLFYFNLF